MVMLRFSQQLLLHNSWLLLLLLLMATVCEAVDPGGGGGGGKEKEQLRHGKSRFLILRSGSAIFQMLKMKIQIRLKILCWCSIPFPPTTLNN